MSLCPLLAISRHSGPPSPMSALPPKADIQGLPPECLLLTKSGHSVDSARLGCASVLLEMFHHGHDVFVDPALVGDIIDQVADQMNSHPPDFTILKG